MWYFVIAAQTDQNTIPVHQWIELSFLDLMSTPLLNLSYCVVIICFPGSLPH